MNKSNIFLLIGQLLALKNSSFIPTAGIYYILSKKIPNIPKYWYPLFSSLIITDMFQKALTNSSNISKKYRKYIYLFFGDKKQEIKNYLKSKNINDLDFSSYTHHDKDTVSTLFDLSIDVSKNLYNPTGFYYIFLFIYKQEKMVAYNVIKYYIHFCRTLFSITMFSTFSFGISEICSKFLLKTDHINIYPYFINMGVFFGALIERKKRWRSIMLFVLSQFLYTKIKFEKLDKHLLAGYVSYLLAK